MRHIQQRTKRSASASVTRRPAAVLAVLAPLTFSLGLAACGSTGTFGTRSAGAETGVTLADDRYERCERCGEVVAIERVSVRGENDGPGVGALIGAVIGGAAGSQLGSGSGQTAATVAGAVGGAVAGDEIQDRREGARGDVGYRFEVELDDGRYAQVVQLDRLGLRAGDRVRIVDERVRPI